MSPHITAAIVVTLLGVLAAALVRHGPTADRDRASACVAGRGDGACLRAAGRSPGSLPLDARFFVDTIGVNTHLFYADTAYGNYPMVERRLRELGVRHIRDGFDPGRTPSFFERVNDLAAAGIRSTLIACRVDPGHPWPTYVKDAKTRVRSALEALEGVNEPDLVAAGSDWIGSARACQRRIHRHARGRAFGSPLGVPVLGPSIQAADMWRLGDISDRADGATIHPYAGGLPPSRPGLYGLASQMARARSHQFGGARVPVYATETGYHDALNTTNTHPPTSQRAISLYLPRMFLEHAKAGVTRTFAYELVDERADPALADVELNFGLFESDWSYKPSAVALRNLIALLDSPRAARRTRLRYSLSNTEDPDGPGPRGAVFDMLLQKRDGSYWLALWQDSTVWDHLGRSDIRNPSTPVRVKLDRHMELRRYRPTQSRRATHRRRARSFTAHVGDGVLLIRMQ